ncbi:MAG: DUF5615 family PIN-like protein [Myxococcales bacterium]|nr:DUF5615 family PIN-like protein [Myxococcales bacterium]
MLATAGLDVVHVRDWGLGEADDATILERARLDGRVVVSRDGDFATLLATLGSTGPSFVHMRTPGVNRPEEQAALLLQAMTAVATDLIAGAILVIRVDRIRIRRLPVGER